MIFIDTDVMVDVLRRYEPFDDFSSHHLSHGLGILDALIAETAVGCEAQLATFNKKHYRVVDALQMIQPYPRL